MFGNVYWLLGLSRYLSGRPLGASGAGGALASPVSAFRPPGAFLCTALIPRRLTHADCISWAAGCVCACPITELCLTLCDPRDCSPPGSSVRGDFPGKNTGVGCHFLLQEIFLTQGSNLRLLHWQVGSLPAGEPPGKPPGCWLGVGN